MALTINDLFEKDFSLILEHVRKVIVTKSLTKFLDLIDFLKEKKSRKGLNGGKSHLYRLINITINQDTHVQVIFYRVYFWSMEWVFKR
jgi:hypothetical protein